MTNPVGFLFQDTPAENGDLVFKPEGVGGTTPAQIAGSFPALGASITLAPVVFVAITGSFDAVTVTAAAAYNSNTDRPFTLEVSSGYTESTPTPSAAHFAHQERERVPAGWSNFWREATRVLSPVEHVLPGNLARLRSGVVAGHAQAAWLTSWALQLYQQADAVRAGQASSAQSGTPLSTGVASCYEEATRLRGTRLSHWQKASRWRLGYGHASRDGVGAPVVWDIGYQEGVPPPPGIYVAPTPPGPPIGCYTPSPELLFSWPAGHSGTHLVFVCGDYIAPQEPITIPIQRVYIVINNTQLRRVDDNTVVPCLSMTLSLDASSWTWGFDATLPPTAQALVEPDANGPVELRASINGTDFRLWAEHLSRSRAFGQVSIQVTGRGRNAQLDAPYSPQQVFTNPQARTHQQLFDDVLTFNNVPLGYTIDYGLEAWTVPANVFNHQGSYISALAALAQAGGAYLIPHPTELSFKVRHRYPVKPWETATADIILPAALMTRESITWTEKPGYNRVYVSGQDQGVLGRITRQGTAGDVLAPMVTDPLITTAAAARQRGQAILGDTGKQLELGISLPVLDTTGIIQPGMYVQYEDGSTIRTGIVRSTRVSVVGQAEVKQTLGLEVHA